MQISAQTSGPMRGVKVIDLTVNILGPVATQILGDMGADVIKVEAPEGDPNRANGPARHPGMAAMFLTFNRNKRSLCLDLKQAAAREALMRLLEDADVFVHSLRTPAIERLGFGYEAVRARNPRIIFANGPGFARGGPRENEPAYDDVIQGATGLATLMGRMFGEPRYLPTVLVDKFCGYALAMAISMALFERERSGRGQQVQVPMFETMVGFNLHEHQWGAAFDPVAEPGFGYSRLMTHHRRPYPTLDGHICVLAANDAQWVRLLGVIGRSELLEDERFCSHGARQTNIDAIYAVITEEIAKRTTDEWMELLNGADLPCGPVRSFEDLLDDPYVRETGLIETYDHPSEGRLRRIANALQFSEGGAGFYRDPPRLGEHNAELLVALGYTIEEIARMAAKQDAPGMDNRG